MEIEITPAVCAVCTNLPVKYIVEKWEPELSKVFRGEEELYGVALNVCSFVFATGGNLQLGSQVFTLTLKDKPKNGLDYDNAPLVEAIFRQYWELGLKDDFWQNGKRAIGAHVPFSTALQIWKNQAREQIEFCNGILKKWLKKN